MREHWNAFRNRGTVYSTTGIVFLIAAGLLLLIRPDIALVTICRLLGVALLIWGVTMLIRSMTGRTVTAGRVFSVPACILIIVGIVIISSPLFLIRISGTLLAIFLIVYGLLSLLRYLRTAGPRDGRWVVGIAGAGVELFMGILLAAAPVRASTLVLRIIGVVLLYAALSASAYRRRVRAGEERYRETAERTTGRFEDVMSRFTGKNRYGKDIIEGTARDVTEDTHLHDK